MTKTAGKKKSPTNRTYSNMKYRCKNRESYIRKGIKCLITKEEIEKLWNRDKGWLLKHPCIDRIDNNGHYTYENCHFIELSENTHKDADSIRLALCKPVNQYARTRRFVKGELIKRHNSVTEASVAVNCRIDRISDALRGFVRDGKKCRTVRGFIWEYAS